MAACGVIEALTLDPMTGIFYPLASRLLLPRLVGIPYPHFIPFYPMLTECIAYAIAPLVNGVPHPPFIPWYPISDHASMRHPLQ